MKNKLAAIFTGLFFILLGLSFYSVQKPGGWDLETFGRIPVVQGGRVKPLDSVARNSLLLLSGKQSFVHHGTRVSAIHWLADMVFNPQVADQYPVFEIDHPEVLGLLHIEQGSRRRFSYYEIHQFNSELEMQAIQINSIKPQDQTSFQRAVVLLVNRINLYQKLENTVQLVGVIQTADDLKKFQELSVGISIQDLKQPLEFGKAAALHSEFLSRLAQHFRFIDSFSYFVALPPLSPNKNWQTLGGGLLSPENGVWHQGILAYAQMADFYRTGNKENFNTTVQNYFQWVRTLSIKEFTRTKAEFIFNRVEPFYFCMVFYFLISLLIFINWLTKSDLVVSSTQVLLGLTFSLHTLALLFRMIIQGRPPVTNLYSSAIFVGWVAILLGIFIERIYRNLFGALVSSVIGFLTLLIAHHLSMQGDPLEMMQAVLDSNFWLATHVVTVTMGYGSTFLAGFIGTVYILKKSFSASFQEDQARSLVKMAYGVICFATLFSFIGTILGGIWADQSWGRFWGWDPKENGALMIVLWNVTILHARWGGYAKDRGIMILAVIGNVVTSLSWFGVNMLGIGLHSYGFMDKAFWWLCSFIVVQALIVMVGLNLKKE